MKVVIIGGGPAGMMAAIKAAENKDNEVTIIDRNDRLGKKLAITGKGRCNVTNAKDISEFFEHISRNKEFLYSAFYSFSNENLMDFFVKRGLELKTERGQRVFPVSDRAYDVITVLSNELEELGVQFSYKTEVEDAIVEEKAIKYLVTNRGNIYGDVFIFAGGGASYQGTGSDGKIHKVIRKIGHKVYDLRPSLIPLVLKENFPKDLQGLSLKNVAFTLTDSKKEIFYDIGEMLFTHFGVSGPLVLSASSFYHGGEAKGYIDFKPGLDYKELDLRIQRDFVKYHNKDFKNALNDLLPSKIIPTMMTLSNIDPMKKCNSITKEERGVLVNLLKRFEVTVIGTKSLNEAIITRGGVDVKEIDPSTMKSKIIDNLSFAGEVIDVDGVTGGYNLQIAFSTGFLAGSSL